MSVAYKWVESNIKKFSVMEGKVYMEDLIVEKYIPNGHEYRKHRETVDGHVAWRCWDVRKLKCKTNAVVDGLKVVRRNNEDHNHEGNIVATALARKALGEMKKVAVEVLAWPWAICFMLYI